MTTPTSQTWTEWTAHRLTATNHAVKPAFESGRNFASLEAFLDSDEAAGARVRLWTADRRFEQFSVNDEREALLEAARPEPVVEPAVRTISHDYAWEPCIVR